MLKLERNEFKDFVNDLDNRGSVFVIEKKRTVNHLIMNRKYLAISKNKNHIAKGEQRKEVISLFAQVSKMINKYIIENNFTVKMVRQRHSSSDTNRGKFQKMKVGSEFYYIDVAHCFWRIAFLNGYINEKYYENVLKKPELKTYRNMALACIVAPRTMEYHAHGKSFEISEDKTLWRIIYDNIRFTSYNLMGDLARHIPNFFIAYRTDGIMVTKPAVKKVKDLLESAGFEYRITKCRKVDDGHYLHGSKVKKI